MSVRSELRGINDVTPHPQNYNEHPESQVKGLQGSLDIFDQYKNIVVWSPAEIIDLGNGQSLHPDVSYILAGHGFWMATSAAGREFIEVKDYTGIPYDEALLLMETDNASPVGAVVDTAKLAELAERTRGLVADRPRLEAMLERAREAAGVAGGNGDEGKDTEVGASKAEADQYQEIWKVKIGDTWQLGRHTIACIDSTDEEAVKALLNGETVNMVWADPPYGINIVAANVSVGGGEAYDIPFGGVKNKGFGSVGGAKPFGSADVRGSDGTANIVDVGKYAEVIGDDTTETARRAATLALRVFYDACHFWWGGNYYTDVLEPSPCWIIWDKDNTGNFADCEMAWTNQGTAVRKFEHRWNGMLKASEQGQRRVHPTQKPVALPQWCFEKYGKPDDVIFDPFLGSGISVIAAENLDDGRRVIGCELSPEYIAVVIQRWADASGGDPVCVLSSQ